ncbi:unnamed protein product [Paramecium primaurelia]|uniref:Uncharacterized protein n=1 Tax=Paramecium primaurelia TaxID=5886 RepID=A0A8S1LTJ7_PARPR|nr:unnamed protein product [Paramecium primaurelia]
MFSKPSNIFGYDSYFNSPVGSYCNSPIRSLDEEIWMQESNQQPIYPEKKKIIDQKSEENFEVYSGTTKIKNHYSEKMKPLINNTQGEISTQQEKEKEIPQIKKLISKKEVHMLPGESKNIPKNYTRALKQFIISNFDSSVLQNADIKKFLATKPEKACKQTLENSLKNCQQLKQISQIFFGNLQWGKTFLEENKVELEPYFRFNSIWFGSKN